MPAQKYRSLRGNAGDFMAGNWIFLDLSKVFSETLISRLQYHRFLLKGPSPAGLGPTLLCYQTTSTHSRITHDQDAQYPE